MDRLYLQHESRSGGQKGNKGLSFVAGATAGVGVTVGAFSGAALS